MGMSVGENKGGAPAEMNVVPLIDILLVLLIIFMVITPWTPKGLQAHIFKHRSEKVAFVEGHNDVVFMDVAPAIDIMRGSGIDKVGLISGQI